MEGTVPNHRNIGWSGEDRQRARNHPEEYPEELRTGLKAALEHINRQQQENYMNPGWEPAIGFLEAAIDGTYPSG